MLWSKKAASNFGVRESRRARTGKLIDSQEEVGSWPDLKSGPSPSDTDNDGLPDAWETAHGLDPKNPADANTVARSGYTQIEDYLNELAAPKK